MGVLVLPFWGIGVPCVARQRTKEHLKPHRAPDLEWLPYKNYRKLLEEYHYAPRSIQTAKITGAPGRVKALLRPVRLFQEAGLP